VRDVGLFVWVVLLFVGVIGSMVSRVRSARQQSPPAPAPRRVSRTIVRIPAPPPPVQSPPPPRQAPPPPVAAPPTRRAQAPNVVDRVVQAPAARRRPLFADRRDLVRAVIAAEVLGKPRALRDERPIP